jgi:hypothetical protein
MSKRGDKVYDDFKEFEKKEREAFYRGNRGSEYGSSTLYEVCIGFVYGMEPTEQIENIEKKLDLDIVHRGKKEYEAFEMKSGLASSYEDEDADEFDEEEYVSQMRVDYVVSYSNLSRPRVEQVIDEFTQLDFRTIEIKITRD